MSALSHVHTLGLSCTSVTDVSALSHVHTLDLSCTGVTDVSALSDVHSLNLWNASVIKKLSELTPDKVNNNKNLAVLCCISNLTFDNVKVRQMVAERQEQEKDEQKGAIARSVSFFKSATITSSSAIEANPNESKEDQEEITVSNRYNADG